MKGPLVYLVSLPLCLCTMLSCNRAAPSKGSAHKAPAQPIQLSYLKKYLDGKEQPNAWQFPHCPCSEPSDTIYQNIPYTCAEALAEMNKRFLLRLASPPNRFVISLRLARVPTDIENF